MYVLIACAVLVIALIAALIWGSSRRKAREEQRLNGALAAIDAELSEAFTKAEAEGDTAVSNFEWQLREFLNRKNKVARSYGYQLTSDSTVVATITQKVKEASKALEKARADAEEARWVEARQLGRPLLTIDQIRERVRQLEEFEERDSQLRVKKHGIDVEGLRRELREAVPVWFAPLFDNADSPEAFNQLWTLFADHWQESYSYYSSVRSYTSQALYPRLEKQGITLDSSKWNEGVAYRRETPGLRAFIGQYPKKAEGYVLRLAADALRDRSFVGAKIALAYCMFSDRYVREIGELRQELARMVSEIEQSEDLSYD